MDFDFGTLIYFILTILFVIIGAVGKKKPQQNKSLQDVQNDAAAEMENESEVFGRNFRRFTREESADNLTEAEEADYGINAEMADLLEAQREDQLIEVAHETEEDRIDELRESIEDEAEQDATPGIMDYEGIGDVIKATEMGSGRELETAESDIDEILEEFKAKNALIYAEIMNPKYL